MAEYSSFCSAEYKMPALSSRYHLLSGFAIVFPSFAYQDHSDSIVAQSAAHDKKDDDFPFLFYRNMIR